MNRNRSFWIVALTAAVVTIGALNGILIAQVQQYRSAAGRASIDATLPTSLENPELTTYLLFSPAQCSSHYLPQLEQWQGIFERYHGSRNWVQPVAVYTSRAELGRLWDTLGFKMAVHVDPDGSILEQLGLDAVPAKVVVSASGRILYREAFPELYPAERLTAVLDQLLATDEQPEARRWTGENR